MQPKPKATLLIPVELQVRELDPKLLLACIAAKRGYASLIGPRREMHFYIPFFKDGVYLSKSMTSGSINVFRWLRELGHDVVAWDEEALVHLPPEAYFKRRLHADTIQYVSYLFAWGQENVELWQKYPEMPENANIRITGNPRGDLLRPELCSIYQRDAEALQKRYGNYLLVNTNFNPVNMYFPDMNLLIPSDEPNGTPVLSRRAKGLGMPLEYAVGFSAHKYAIFRDFQKLLPNLEKAFPDYNIIVRPHPAENTEVYYNIAKRCQRVHVTNEGNVVPWLIAAKAMIHNGCTTGVEAFMLGVPAISYRASVHERFDFDYHHLPNSISYECFSFDELQQQLNDVLAGADDGAKQDKSKALMQHFLAAQEGPLACDRMLDIIDEMVLKRSANTQPTVFKRLDGLYRSVKRRLKKKLRGFKTEMSHNRGGFLQHRYPQISSDTLRTRMTHIQQALGMQEKLKLTKQFRKFYRISM